MPAVSNIMKVTNKSLSTISEILIDTYLYNGDISSVGSVTITGNGTASRFNPSSYFKKEGIEFKGITSHEDVDTGDVIADFHPAKVTVSGNFSTLDDSGNTVFVLTGTHTLSVILNSTSIIAYLDQQVLMSFGDFKLEDNTLVNVELSILPESINLDLKINGITYSNSVPYEMLNTSTFNSILIGIDSPGSENYWRGSLELSKFFIYEDNEILYSPTEKEGIEFTSIVISHPKYEITDNTTSIINKAYEIPVKEISRTGNHVLLKATIPDKIYLTIGNIGLFCDVNGRRQLFSLITGLNLKKGSDIGYDLVFHVNTNINVVNTEVLPEIILREHQNTTKNYLEDIRRIFLDANVDLERAIQKNAAQIGYNRAQIFYRDQQNNKITEDNYFKTSTLLKCNPAPIVFYPFIHNSLNYYKVPNIADYNSLNSLEVLDGAFKSFEDPVNFIGSTTLCLTLNLPDFSDKIILSKRDVTNDNTYFVLELKNNTLIFTLYSEEDIHTINIPIRVENYSEFHGINLLSFVNDSERIFVYFNKQLINGVELLDYEPISDLQNFSLLNYTDASDINQADIYINDILFFKEAFSSKNFYLLENLFQIPDRAITLTAEEQTYVDKLLRIRNQNITVIENGVYSADPGYTGLGTVKVQVPNQTEQLSVTTNDVYEAPEGKLGYSKVTVDVPKLLNLQDKTVTMNGTYTFEPEYNGLGEVTVNVPSDVPIDLKKCNLSISNFIGTEINGVLQARTLTPNLIITEVKDIGSYVLQKAFTRNTELESVSFSDLERVSGDYALDNAFANDTELSSLSFPKLKSISGDFAMKDITQGSFSVSSIDLSKLENISGSECLYGAFKNTNISSVDFSSLKTISGTRAMEDILRQSTYLASIDFSALTTIGLNSASGDYGHFYNAFQNCSSLTVLSFPSLEFIYCTGLYNTSLGTFAENNYVEKMYFPKLRTITYGDGASLSDQGACKFVFYGCTSLTELHFAAANQSAIEASPGYSTAWGASNVTIYFDL